MSTLIDLLIGTLTQGLIYAQLAFGLYITYKLLDFPDLTVDGSFPLGAAITAVAMAGGCNPYLAMLVAAATGALAGLITGWIHVRLKVRDLLAGIITMTALFSINLQIAGSNLPIERSTDTIFNAAPTMALFGSLTLMQRKLVVSLILAVIVKVLLDLYFKTRSSRPLRAAGDNSGVVTAIAKDVGRVKILGLVLANALVALSGSIVAQEQRAFSSTMGTGQMVFGLAAVIIGTTLFKRLSFVKGTTAAIVGSILYKACIQLAISLGLPANLLKLVTAALFLVILALGNLQKGKVKRHA